VGGQTALNLAVELSESGILEKYKVEMIGASLRAIKVAEDRLWFKDACKKLGLEVPNSALVNNAQDALRLCDQLGFPLVIRPSFTMGGAGGSIAYNKEEFGEAINHALDMSPVHEALVEESVLGWKEYELEVMRDKKDNFVVICSIENFDPMGVHTGDSITVAPAQTLTDKEYQRMRDAAAAIIREVGVETGGSNVQFAVNPENARLPQQRAGQQSHWVPHRQNCRPPCRGHDARRNSQRHHAKNARLLRAHHRLRGGKNPQMAI
jgi:carbamoyl-phosphate synthase large subunit